MRQRITPTIAAAAISLCGCSNTPCVEPVTETEQPLTEEAIHPMWEKDGTLVLFAQQWPPHSAEVVDYLEQFVDIDVRTVSLDLPPDLSQENLRNMANEFWAQNPERPALLLLPLYQSYLKGTSPADTQPFGFLEWDGDDRGHIVLNRRTAEMQPINADLVQHINLLHEIGHFLKIPARDHHRVMGDEKHCTHGGCAMQYSACGMGHTIANFLQHGMPTRFCESCTSELLFAKQMRGNKRNE